MPTVKYDFPNASPDEKKFAQEAIDLLQDVVNSDEFMKFVQDDNYSGRRLRTAAAGKNYIQATNQQIVDIIKEGREFRENPANNTINLKVKLAKLGSNVLGSMNPPNPQITTNKTFFDQWKEQEDALSLAAHWMHEWMHVAGFRHVKKNGSVDRHDVPYKTGKNVVTTGRAILINRALAQLTIDKSVESITTCELSPIQLAKIRGAGEGYFNAPITHMDEAEVADESE